jgi:biopolymer transport protein TolR
MAVQVGNGSGDPTLSEINVTPLVDVMLVLLIIFMVTAPLMKQGVDVALPQTQAQPIEHEQEDNLVLSITAERKIYVSSKGAEIEIPRDELVTKLEHNEKLKRDREIFLEADRSLPYGFVVDVMADLKRAGVEKMGMITESPPPDEEG